MASSFFDLFHLNSSSTQTNPYTISLLRWLIYHLFPCTAIEWFRCLCFFVVGEFQLYGVLQRGYRTLNSGFGNSSKVIGSYHPNGMCYEKDWKSVEDMSFFFSSCLDDLTVIEGGGSGNNIIGISTRQYRFVAGTVF